MGLLCHIINNDSGLYDVTSMIKLVDGSSESIPTTKRDKLHMKVKQLEWSEKMHIIWPFKILLRPV